MRTNAEMPLASSQFIAFEDLLHSVAGDVPDGTPLLCRTAADLAVSLALSGTPRGAQWYPAYLPSGQDCPAGAVEVCDALLDGRIDSGLWNELERLWLRCGALFGSPPLMWWYLMAFGAPDGKPASPAERTDSWVAELDRTEPALLPRRLAELAGLAEPASLVLLPEASAGTGLLGLTVAARYGIPFIVRPTPGDCVELLRQIPDTVHVYTTAGVAEDAVSERAVTVLSGPAPQIPDRVTADFVRVRRPEFGRTHAAVMDHWTGMKSDDREAVLRELEEKLAILGPVAVYCAGNLIDNKTGMALLQQAFTAQPEIWDYAQLVFLTALRIHQLSGIGFTEFNRAELTLCGLHLFVQMKCHTYASHDTPPPSVFEAAQRLVYYRQSAEQSHVRSFFIDGGSWERREFLLPLSAVPVAEVHKRAASLVSQEFGLEPGPAGPDMWDGVIRRLAANGDDPANLFLLLADNLVLDDVLGADYVTITVPRGVKLDAPWTFQHDDVFSYTAVRPRFDSVEHKVRLDELRIRNAICQRMRYNVTCRGKNYSPDRAERMGAQPFQYVDIAYGEDAHHSGHGAVGIRNVCRSAFLVTIPDGREWRGLGDLRINRAMNGQPARFGMQELPWAVAWSWCFKAIAETAYRLGVVLSGQHCRKLTEIPPARSAKAVEMGRGDR